ncbi:MAG TPA: hypothetical protein VMG60_07745 [Burkholderiaceae bacterium]|nr:hypothetical protein [Burkholderiaceae bacterium]
MVRIMVLGSAGVRAAIASALLGACTATTSPPPGAGDKADVQRIALTATSFNAGEVAYIVLMAREHHTEVVLKVSGVPGWVWRPVHLYAYIHQGSCANLSERPAYALTDRVLTRRDGDGFLTLNNTVEVDLSTLRDGHHAFVVRSSPADANRPLFCGDLPPAQGPPSSG